MANNVNIPQKNTGDFRTAAEDNLITDWINSPGQSLGAWTPGTTILDGSGTYDSYTATGNITIAFSGTPELNNWQRVRITGLNGIYKIILPDDAEYNDSFTDSVAPDTGIYNLWMTYLHGAYSFNLEPVNIKGAATPLAELTLGTPAIGDTKITIPFTNPNSSNEDQNQLYYKLATEPTTWTTGITAVTGATTFPAQTGLTNDLEYDFKAVAEGSGDYSDSADSNEVSATPVAAVIPSAGLICEYKTDGNMLDTSGNSYNGTNVGGTYGADRDGTPNSALELISTEADYANIDASLTGLSTNTKGTIGVWVKLNSMPGAGSFYGIAAWSRTSASLERILLTVLDDGRVQFINAVGGSNKWFGLSDSQVLFVGTWAYVMLIQDGVSPILKIDNVAVAQSLPVSIDTTTWFNDSLNIDNGRLGDYNGNAAGEDNHLDGLLDSLRVYDRDLTTQEQTQLFEE